MDFSFFYVKITQGGLKMTNIISKIYEYSLEEIMEKNPLKVDMIMQHLSGRLRHLTADYADACEEVSTLANWIH